MFRTVMYLLTIMLSASETDNLKSRDLIQPSYSYFKDSFPGRSKQSTVVVKKDSLDEESTPKSRVVRSFSICTMMKQPYFEIDSSNI